MPATADQLDLIDVLPENVKKIRSLIRKRDEHHDLHLEHNTKAKELDKKIWEEVQAAGGKLDQTGKLSLKLSDEEVLVVSLGEARLSCTVKTPKKSETVEDDEEEEAGEAPPEAPTRKPRKE